MTIEECQKILQQDGNKYTLEESEVVLKFITMLIETQYPESAKYLRT